MVKRQTQDWGEPDMRKELLVLFHEWADPKLKAYKEPTRLGVSRGHPIGFPRKKYKAALLHALYGKSFNLADLAGMAGVSHDQMRSWRREDEFKKVANEAAKDFTIFLIELLFTPGNEKQAEILLRPILLIPGPLNLLIPKLQSDFMKSLQGLEKGALNIDAWRMVLTRLDFAGSIFSFFLKIGKHSEINQQMINSMLPIFNIFLDNAIILLRSKNTPEKLKDIATDIIKVVATFAPRMR